MTSAQTQETPPAAVVRPDTEVIPMDLWAADHWSTLAYIETVMVDMNGAFQIGWDPRMRQNRVHFRAMWEQCPKPARPGRTTSSTEAGPIQGMVMDEAHRTRLNDGSTVSRHDDWNCVQDMADAGLFAVNQPYPEDEVIAFSFRDDDPGLRSLFAVEPEAGPEGPILIDAEECEPGVFLRLSPLGLKVTQWVRERKMRGVRFADMRATHADFADPAEAIMPSSGSD